MRRIHLIRHGEVQNPSKVLYGRLPGFGLSSRGASMARLAALALRDDGRRVGYLLSSPLQRAIESAKPVAEVFGLPIVERADLTEASSRLEGGRYDMSLSILLKPAAWRFMVNPFRPSWGESYLSVISRMRAELIFARDLDGDDDVVIVTHQLPIWMVHRDVSNKRGFHDPRKRRCALSSITTVVYEHGRFRELDYREPGRGLI